MALTFTGSGGLFTRLGKLFYVLDILNSWRGTTLPTEVRDAIVEVDGAAVSTALRDTMVPGLLSAEKSASTGLGSLAAAVRTAGERLLIKMVDDDNPLKEKTVEGALREMLRQMRTGSYYVTANVVGMSATETGLTGNGSVSNSLVDAYGRGLQNLLAEDIELAVTSTSTAGQEQISARGEEAISDRLHADYPSGSGGNVTYSCCDAASSQNLILNGGFENWTGVNLNEWTAVTGAFGTDWIKETTTVYKGSHSVKLLGDGASAFQIKQAITSKVSANKQYAVNVWARHDGVAPAAGVLTCDLHDGTSVINDNAGTANSQALDLTTLTGTFSDRLHSFHFRIPEPKPTAISLRLHLSTPLTAPRAIFLDHLGMCESRPAYDGGPFLAFFSGAVNYTLEDYTGGGSGGARVFKFTTTNNRAGKWQTYFDRVFEMRRLGLVLPTSGATLINDALIG